MVCLFACTLIPPHTTLHPILPTTQTAARHSPPSFWSPCCPRLSTRRCTAQCCRNTGCTSGACCCSALPRCSSSPACQVQARPSAAATWTAGRALRQARCLDRPRAAPLSPSLPALAPPPGAPLADGLWWLGADAGVWALRRLSMLASLAVCLAAVEARVVFHSFHQYIRLTAVGARRRRRCSSSLLGIASRPTAVHAQRGRGT